MIPGIGLSELIVIFVVLLLVVGPHKLPEVARNIGRMISRLKQASYEFKRALYLDELRDEVYQPIKEWNPTQEVKQFVDQVAQETFSPDSSSTSQHTLEHKSGQIDDASQHNDEHDDEHEDHYAHDEDHAGEYHTTPFSKAVTQAHIHSQNPSSSEDLDDDDDDDDDDLGERIPSQDPLMADVFKPKIQSSPDELSSVSTSQSEDHKGDQA